ncbi:SPFH domain-containing protein [Janibacter limosus]|jgi:regulator of protease activity HflC (stomatin/prohibitin superfamily)|uniref:SPFH domain-containing protein n=2 Tax=Janibacter limosus TaxID=53458 RepID=A0A4P6MVS5_9MICO|nr:SPFH domain-containing protein [Janibacter limosus]
MNAARQVAGAAGMGQAVDQVMGQAQGAGFDLNARDFPAARGEGGTAGTRINTEHVSLDDAAEALSRSRYEMGQNGPVHVITPMIMPKGRRLKAMLPVILLVIIGFVGSLFLLPFGTSLAVFGPHYWILVLAVAAFMWWRQGMVMVPEGCTALISRFGKVEAEVGPGRVTLWNPWKRVSYIVNTTREYPFNAPIRSAPTKSGVQASVDLFLQFRIVSAREFVFVLGAVQGFQDKLNNAISETTRSLIYEQEASGIYDLVGESTARLLDQLNAQFAPAVELTTANITHAEPSAQEYRMDLAAPEMIRVAKEAYTYDYELGLKKEQNEGDLNKDLASLNENLSGIQADIARYQAQMDTALERETNRAEAVARQRFVESESDANANAALLEAQALDIRALSAALAPEILDYRYQQDMLDKMQGVSGSLPQIVRIGEESEGVDYLQIARQLVGGQDAKLFTAEDMEAIRSRQGDIAERISAREADIVDLLQAPEETDVEILPVTEPETDLEGEQRLDEIRQSVTDESVAEALGEVRGTSTPPPPAMSPEAPEAPEAPEVPAAPEPPAPPVDLPPPPPMTEPMSQTDPSEGERNE